MEKLTCHGREGICLIKYIYKTNLETCKLTFSSLVKFMDKFGLFKHHFKDVKVQSAELLPCSQKTSANHKSFLLSAFLGRQRQ